MKTISANMTTHITSEVTRLATCWKLALTNGTTQGFTNSDTDVVYDSVTYSASTGLTPSAVEGSARLEVPNLEVQGILTSVEETAILAGDYDYAEVTVFLIRPDVPTDGIIPLYRGWLGEVRLARSIFTAEIRGLAQRVQQQIGERFSVDCRAGLGDSRCGVTLATYTVTGTITGVTSRQVFEDSSRGEATGIFNFGQLTWTSGLNDGRKMEVKTFVSGGTFTLAQPMPANVQVGDGYSVYQGCDKARSTCISRFNNIDNFRGEPFIPGGDALVARGLG